MSASPAQKPRRIVIVGGGIIGSSIAYYLSRVLPKAAAATSAATKASSSTEPSPSSLDSQPRDQSLSVTLLETSSKPAPGASGKAGGFLALDWHGPTTRSLAELSFELHRSLAEKDEGEKKWGYRQVETMQVSFDTSKRSRKRSGLGNGVEDQRLGWLDHEIVTSKSSMGGNGTTAQVNPEDLTHHLVNEAKAQGVEFLFDASATGLDLDASGRVKAVRVEDANSGREHSIKATDVVLAAGPWTGSLITKLFPRNRVPSFLRNATSIDGSRAHSVVIKSSGSLSADCLFTEMAYGEGGRKAGSPEVYCRPDGTAYVCGSSDDEPLPKTVDQVGFDESKTRILKEQASVVSPSALDTIKGSAEVVREQACYLPISNRTGDPIIGGRDGIYVAAGHSCWGITNSLGTGKVIAELLLEGKAKSADIRSLMPK
ncbi:FAD dependent oxidoreductase [Violaceomyces palustris]|uniref:FAD dependent oxidoreductase n=1 Tax=Violaceomyces palustris TaxID=1673888 RepID=A0ACD0NYK9_9BASI|nr:FAD dependent oxidoreductase [Violaceomyces palustris]